MGEVVDLPCGTAVEFDDQALATIARMAAALLGTAEVMRRSTSEDTTRRGIEIIDDLAPHGHLLSEHIEVIEKYAEDILAALTEDEEGYFSNDSKIKKMTVMSIIKKKCRTIRIQRFFVTSSGHRAIQDNDKIALECHDGALACGLGYTPRASIRVKAGKARA